MTSDVAAFLLCRRKGDNKYLCICNNTLPEQYSFFSVCVEGTDRASYDTLRHVALSLLDLQLFDMELSEFSVPINGSHGPPIVFCEVQYLLDKRMVRRIQEKSLLKILFLSLEEIQRMALDGKIAHETVEIIQQIKQ